MWVIIVERRCSSSGNTNEKLDLVSEKTFFFMHFQSLLGLFDSTIFTGIIQRITYDSLRKWFEERGQKNFRESYKNTSPSPIWAKQQPSKLFYKNPLNGDFYRKNLISWTCCGICRCIWNFEEAIKDCFERFRITIDGRIKLFTIEKYGWSTIYSESITFCDFCSNLRKESISLKTFCEFYLIEYSFSCIDSIGIWYFSSWFCFFEGVESFFILDILPLFCTTESSEWISFCIWMDRSQWKLFIGNKEESIVGIFFKNWSYKFGKSDTRWTLEISIDRKSMFSTSLSWRRDHHLRRHGSSRSSWVIARSSTWSKSKESNKQKIFHHTIGALGYKYPDSIPFFCSMQILVITLSENDWNSRKNHAKNCIFPWICIE